MTDNSHRFDFNDRIRISESSLSVAISELNDLHEKAHEDNRKGKLIEFADLAACPFCTIFATISQNNELALMVAEFMTDLIDKEGIAEELVAINAVGIDIISMLNRVFIHSYAIGMKCGRNDAIAEFTNVK